MGHARRWFGQLLWSSIKDSAERFFRELRRGREPSEVKIGQVRDPFLAARIVSQHDIFRLDISVDHVPAMSMLKCFGDLHQKFESVRRFGDSAYEIPKIRSVDKVHIKPYRAIGILMDPNYMRVFKLLHRSITSLKPGRPSPLAQFQKNDISCKQAPFGQQILPSRQCQTRQNPVACRLGLHQYESPR